MSESAQERIAAFTKAVDQARQDVDRLGLMQEEIKAIESVEMSPDRSVTVVAGAQGSVRSIKITDAAMTKSAQTLGQVVTRTLQLAVAKAARQQAEIVQRYAGADSKIVEKVNAVQEELLNPKTADGFQLHHDGPADDGSVLVSSDRQGPPQSVHPSYPAANHPAPPMHPTPTHPAPNPPGGPQAPPSYPPASYPPVSYPKASYPQPIPPAGAARGPAPRPADDSYDDYSSGAGVLHDSGPARPRPTQSGPPASGRGDDEVFHFGGEDY